MTQGTKVDNDALIEEMMRDAEETAEPGTLHSKTVIHEGDETLPSPMIVKSIDSAGYAPIYDTQTGERSLTNKNMLRAQLGKKRPDGTPYFTTKNPNIKPKTGTLKCMLHPDDPNRGYYDELGLPVCRKSNLTSPYQVKRHMQKRHPSAWETIEEEIRKTEKEEDRKLQRSLIKQIGKRSKK
jgi:hypothetical protein